MHLAELNGKLHYIGQQVKRVPRMQLISFNSLYSTNPGSEQKLDATIEFCEQAKETKSISNVQRTNVF